MADTSIEDRLARAERSLVAHDFLLRALLTQLAVTSPASFHAIIGGFVNSRRYAAAGEAGDLTREVADQLVAMADEIARSLHGR